MMEDKYTNPDITELPLSSTYFRDRLSRFLEASGLRLEALDAWYAVLDEGGEILAGAGISNDIVKCVAVAPELRSEGLLTPLISRIIAEAAGRGVHNLKVFTKPEYRGIFESLGFKALASAPKAVLLENGGGLRKYLDTLPMAQGVAVLNANPFTNGHKYLVEKALEEVETLVVIPVMEDISAFSYMERLRMMKDALGSYAPRVKVADGSAYTISAATFPTYFLKSLDDAAEQQMRLDLDLFRTHIMPAIGARKRFVGTEPSDSLTARYNALMKEYMEVTEIERLEGVSASKVRAALDRGDYKGASAMVPAESRPYLLSYLAAKALEAELDLPLKPGLVCPETSGAHKDMDYNTMRRGIDAIRPFFPAMAQATTPAELQKAGIDAEEAMLRATGGVNTHRGAIFALGLALNAAARLHEPTAEGLQQLISASAKSLSPIPDAHPGARSARRMAEGGYSVLFADWLHYTDRTELLLSIMSTLDDTCILKRAGAKRAQEVKQEAKELLQNYTEEKLKDMCERYAQEGISPGGAADMLALTIFINTVL